MTTEIEKLRNALANAAAGLEWCARRDAGRMASPNLHDYPEKWAREAYDAFEASEWLEFDILSIQATAIATAIRATLELAEETAVDYIAVRHGYVPMVASDAMRAAGSEIASGIRAITAADVLERICGE